MFSANILVLLGRFGIQSCLECLIDSSLKAIGLFDAGLTLTVMNIRYFGEQGLAMGHIMLKDYIILEM